jgi:hypothetical protein
METFTSRKVIIKARGIVERYGFARLHNANTYLSVYEPEEAPGKRIIVICDTLWDEQERTLVFNTRLARNLAADGYTVVRFDYTGSGNSDEENGFITFDSLFSDVQNVVNWCFEQYRSVVFEALISERIGCHITYKNPQLAQTFRKNIFIHPVLNISHFFTWNFIEREIVNTNAFSEKKISRPELLERISRGGEVDLNGYTFNTTFVQEIMSTAELWNSDLPVSGCHYIFDENFYRNKKKWGEGVNALHAEVIKMDSIPVSTWDREDLDDDGVFFQTVFTSISNYLQ